MHDKLNDINKVTVAYVYDGSLHLLRYWSYTSPEPLLASFSTLPKKTMTFYLDRSGFEPTAIGPLK